MTKKVRGGLPAWSQMLIGFVLAGFVGLIGSFVWFFVLMHELARDSINPACMAKTAQDIAVFPDPLPRGNAYEFAFSLGNLRCITIEQSPAKQKLVLFCMKNVDPPDAKETVYKAYDIGVSTLENNVASQEIKSKGELSIGSEKLLYLLGEVKCHSGRKQEWMVGSVSDKTSHKNIVIFAWQPMNHPFDKNLTMAFLNSIKHF
jgi:hypothetical protein